MLHLSRKCPWYFFVTFFYLNWWRFNKSNNAELWCNNPLWINCHRRPFNVYDDHWKGTTFARFYWFQFLLNLNKFLRPSFRHRLLISAWIWVLLVLPRNEGRNLCMIIFLDRALTMLFHKTIWRPVALKKRKNKRSWVGCFILSWGLTNAFLNSDMLNHLKYLTMDLCYHLILIHAPVVLWFHALLRTYSSRLQLLWYMPNILFSYLKFEEQADKIIKFGMYLSNFLDGDGS